MSTTLRKWAPLATGIVMLGLSVLCLLAYHNLQASRRAFQAAPVCGPSGHPQTCRVQIEATVTKVFARSGKYSKYYLIVKGAPPADGGIDFSDENDVIENVGVYDTVTVDVWRGKPWLVSYDGLSAWTAESDAGFTPALAGAIAFAIGGVALTIAGVFLPRTGPWGREIQLIAMLATGPFVTTALAGLFGLGDTTFRDTFAVWALLAFGAVVSLVMTFNGWRQGRFASPGGTRRRRKRPPSTHQAGKAANRSNRYRRVIHVTAPPRPRFRPASRAARIVAAWLLGAAGVTALITTTSNVISHVREEAAYSSAPTCAGSPPSRGCRALETAAIQEVHADGGNAGNELSLVTMLTPDGESVPFSSDAAAFLSSLGPGSFVTVERWHGTITNVSPGQFTSAWRPTADNPEHTLEVARAVFIVTASLTFALLQWLAWIGVRKRRWFWVYGIIGAALLAAAMALLLNGHVSGIALETEALLVSALPLIGYRVPGRAEVTIPGTAGARTG